jgi:ribosomal protein L12E/L44/L45/RPP1/RPP2
MHAVATALRAEALDPERAAHVVSALQFSPLEESRLRQRPQFEAQVAAAVTGSKKRTRESRKKKDEEEDKDENEEGEQDVGVLWLGSGPDEAWASELVGSPVPPAETGMGVASTFALASRGPAPVATTVSVPVLARVATGFMEAAKHQLAALAALGKLPAKSMTPEVRKPDHLSALMCGWPATVHLQHKAVTLQLPQCANGRNCVGFLVQAPLGSSISPSSLVASMSWDEVMVMAASGALPLGLSMRPCVLCVWREVQNMLHGDPDVCSLGPGPDTDAGAGTGTSTGTGWEPDTLVPYTVEVGPGGYDAAKCFMPVHRPGSGIRGGALPGPFPALNLPALSWMCDTSTLPGVRGRVFQVNQGGMLNPNPGPVTGGAWDLPLNRAGVWSELVLAPGAAPHSVPVIREVDLEKGSGTGTGGAFRNNDTPELAFVAATMATVVPPARVLPDIGGGSGSGSGSGGGSGGGSGSGFVLGLPCDGVALDF